MFPRAEFDWRALSCAECISGFLGQPPDAPRCLMDSPTALRSVLNPVHDHSSSARSRCNGDRSFLQRFSTNRARYCRVQNLHSQSVRIPKSVRSLRTYRSRSRRQCRSSLGSGTVSPSSCKPRRANSSTRSSTALFQRRGTSPFGRPHLQYRMLTRIQRTNCFHLTLISCH